MKRHSRQHPARIREGFYLLAGLYSLLLLCCAPMVTAVADDDLLPEPGPRLGEFLRDLERRFERQEGEREERLRDFKRELDEERKHLLEDNEELWRSGEEALEEFMGDVNRHLEEHGVDLEERFREIENLVREQGETWFRELEDWGREDERDDVPSEAAAPVRLTFFVLAHGVDWPGSQPLPPALAPIAEQVAVGQENLVLLDRVVVRSTNHSGFRFNSHLPDRAPGNPLPYSVGAETVSTLPKGGIRLAGFEFESRIELDDVPRVLFLGNSATIDHRGPTLLGTVSIRGAEEALLVAGLVE